MSEDKNVDGKLGYIQGRVDALIELTKNIQSNLNHYITEHNKDHQSIWSSINANKVKVISAWIIGGVGFGSILYTMYVFFQRLNEWYNKVVGWTT